VATWLTLLAWSLYYAIGAKRKTSFARPLWGVPGSEKYAKTG